MTVVEVMEISIGKHKPKDKKNQEEKETHNTQFNLTFVLSRKRLKAFIASAIPFFIQLSRQLCRCYTHQQRHKCRLSGSYVDTLTGVLVVEQ
ncbi:MAG: hypothetical protein ACTTH7_08290 [Treponema sp.]